MPGRRRTTQTRDSNAVRGPNSALTAFLREQGINANVIRERHLARINGEQQDSSDDESEQEQTPDTEQDQEEEQMMRQAAREKRRRANGSDDDEDEDEEDEDYDDENTPTPRKSLPGEKIKCIECFKKFRVTAYTKSFVKDGNRGYLCDDCNELQKIKLKNLKKTQLKARKKRALMAKSLLDQKEFNIPTLQDTCIRLISDNINHVENLGDIGSVNYEKLGRILSKNRSLNNKTISLFLMSNITQLEFWDCSNVDNQSFDKMIAYCPNLVHLNLSMCGQFNNQNLLNLATLPYLESVRLDGPFLINEQTWQDFFERMGNKLQRFKLGNTHRFDNAAMQSMLANCGDNLQELSLFRLDALTDSLAFELLPHYVKNLTHLQISYPAAEILDEALINILQENPNLETLILENLEYITDISFETLLLYCGNLQNLTITDTNITNEGFNKVFSNWSTNHGLMELNLYNNLQLQDAAMLAILQHSKNSLIKLNINSCSGLSYKFWKHLPTLPLLTVLDCGFVRSFDNKALRNVIKNCENLKILECYGCNKCNDPNVNKKSLKIIGREIDTLL